MLEARLLAGKGVDGVVAAPQQTHVPLLTRAPQQQDGQRQPAARLRHGDQPPEERPLRVAAPCQVWRQQSPLVLPPPPGQLRLLGQGLQSKAGDGSLRLHVDQERMGSVVHPQLGNFSLAQPPPCRPSLLCHARQRGLELGPPLAGRRGHANEPSAPEKGDPESPVLLRLKHMAGQGLEQEAAHFWVRQKLALGAHHRGLQDKAEQQLGLRLEPDTLVQDAQHRLEQLCRPPRCFDLREHPGDTAPPLLGPEVLHDVPEVLGVQRCEGCQRLQEVLVSWFHQLSGQEVKQDPRDIFSRGTGHEEPEQAGVPVEVSVAGQKMHQELLIEVWSQGPGEGVDFAMDRVGIPDEAHQVRNRLGGAYAQLLAHQRRHVQVEGGH
mmetsp:Transcript_13793/g.39048  ORF Transcript_13793/g.39048 Transcript_13793/m.39048 type:complete len:379 (+) Transcript_13793:528-1664(+)